MINCFDIRTSYCFFYVRLLFRFGHICPERELIKYGHYCKMKLGLQIDLLLLWIKGDIIDYQIHFHMFKDVVRFVLVVIGYFTCSMVFLFRPKHVERYNLEHVQVVQSPLKSEITYND